MASFSSKLLAFNPYIKQIPVEEYANVLMQKQGQYEQGVSTVNNYLESIAGLEVIQPEQKKYLQQRYSQLESEANRVASEDFTSKQLVTQLGNLATTIRKDPIISNAVDSTKRYQSELARLQKDKNEGKLTPQNEYNFQKKANNWLSNKDARASFNESYSPYVDIMGEFLKTYKEIHQDSNITQDAFRIQNGKVEINPAIEQTSFKGVTPERVAGVANMLFSRPEIANQLAIEGDYSYRGMDMENVALTLKGNVDGTIKNINERIQELEIQKVQDKTANTSEISNMIEQLKNQGTKILNDYSSSANLINENPDAFKTMSYKNNLMSQMISNYSWAEKSKTFEKSPVFDAQMQTLNYELSKAKFSLDKDQFAYQQDYNAQKMEMDLRIAAMKAKGEEGGEGTFTLAGNTPESSGERGASSFQDMKAGKITELNQALFKGVFDMVNSEMSKVPNPIKRNVDGTYSPNVDPTGTTGYTSMEEAKLKYNQIYSEARKKIMSGKATEGVQKAFSNIDPLIRSVKAIETKEALITQQYAPQLERLKSSVGDLNTSLAAAGGKVVTRNDLVDFWLSNGGTEEAKNAQQRIKAKFPNNEIGQMLYGESPVMQGKVVVKQGRSANSALASEYKKVEGTLSQNKDLVSVLKNREQAYKDAQMVYQPLETTVVANDNKTKEDLRQRFAKIAVARVSGNNSDEIEEFQAFLKKEGTDKDDKFTGSNIYGFERDRTTGKAFLTITRGGEKRKMEVSESDLSIIPGAQVNNSFWKKYGDDLSLTNNVTTDVNNSGETTAYILPRPSNSKYSVKYHLTNDGSSYGLKLYVRDSQGNILQSDLNPGISTSMAGVMEAIERLKSDAQLESIPGLRK